MRNRAHYINDGSAPSEVLGDVIRARRDAQLPEVDDDAPSKLSLDVGKFAGVVIADLPTWYLHFLRDEFLRPFPSQRPAIAAALLELKRREQHGERK